MSDSASVRRAIECVHMLYLAARRGDIDVLIVAKAICDCGCQKEGGCVVRAMQYMAHYRLAENELDIAAWRTLRLCVSDNIMMRVRDEFVTC